MPAVASYNTRSHSLAEGAARHRPWLRNCCTICLGLDHQRSHCIYLITQRKLRYAAARYKEPEPTRKQPAATSISLPLRRGGSSRAFTRSDPYATPQIPQKGSPETVKVRALVTPPIEPKAIPVALEPKNTVSRRPELIPCDKNAVPRRDELCPYDKTYHALKSEQSRLHEKLCGGRCADYGHQDGACASVPCEDFEKVHIRQLEREAARRSKAEARIFGGARRVRAMVEAAGHEAGL